MNDMVTSDASARRTVGLRTGGRAERVVHAVLEATLDELARVGYGALRTDDVATRAGVNKTTVYRRWPTKAQLVEAAVRQRVRLDEPVPDTGSLRDDLRALVDTVLRLLRTPGGRAVARLVANEGGDPDVDKLARLLRDRSRARRALVVERAKERGELPKNVDGDLLVDIVFSPLIGPLMRFGEMPKRERIEAVIDLAVTGAEHGGGQKRRRF